MADIGKQGLDELVQVVSFKLGLEEFGIDILKVQEIMGLSSFAHITGNTYL